jgi:chromate transporter
MLAWINTITLGGGYAIVPVICTSLEKRRWMTEEHFYDVFARAQAYPGPTALSTSLLVSIGLCGFWGGVAAFFGVVVPPFIAIIFVSSLLTTYGSLPTVKRFLEGAGAVVPGLVAAMVYKTGKRRKWILPRVVETAILALLLVFFPSFSLPILLGGIVAMYFLEGIWKR